MTTTPAPATPPTASTPVPSTLHIVVDRIFLMIFILVGVYWLSHAWLVEHDARVKAEASVASAQKSIDSAAGDKKQLLDEQKVRDEQTAAAIEKISAAAAAQKTPTQITNWIPSQFARLPVPIEASIAPATPQNPAPPAVITVPQADLGLLRNQVASCQQNALALPSAQQDLSACAARAKLSEEQLAAAKQQVDELQQELKGGTFWHRFKSGAKKVGIGIAIGTAVGAAALCQTGHCK